MRICKYEVFIKSSEVWEVPNTKISSANDVYQFATEYLNLDMRDREYFSLLAINTKGEIIGCHDVSVGGLSSAPVHPREVLKYAILSSAASIIALHNHPSGDSTPSDADINLTRRLKDACEIVGITLLDHVIVGNGEYTSFASESIL